jgi:NAD(P)-dependent dehydrogenase (short-subunit alcohol dehydrogenase family)
MGGSSGIGLASARLLARDGADVTITGRTQDKLRDATQNLRDEGLAVTGVACDAQVPGDVRAAVDVATADDRLDIAVVLPGWASFSPVLLFGDEELSREIALNVQPFFLTMKYGVPKMIESGGGAVVAMSSDAATFSTRFLSSLAAGKSAIDAIVRVAADELGEVNVRVNSVRPGLTRTPPVEFLFENAALLAEFEAGKPLGRAGEAEDVAHAIRFLAGPESSWITGQCLGVDGGHTLRSFPDLRVHAGHLMRQRAPD